MFKLWQSLLFVGVVAVAWLLSLGSAVADDPWPLSSPAAVCSNPALLSGPDTPPEGAIVIEPGTSLSEATNAAPAGSVFWLAPGVHTLSDDQFDQVVPKSGNQYVGGPGAVLDGRGVNRYAFGQQASNVRIAYLTVRNFVSPRDEGVVNHDSASGWTVEHSTVELNGGAGIMGGPQMTLRYNCIRNNDQYGFQFFQAGDGITDIVIDHNEVTGNNTGDWESRLPGCGCSGATKFWAVNGAVITNNWVHDNRGAGLWADTNNRDFLIEGNLIENNDGIGLFYEISYNAIVRGNTFRGNAKVTVPQGFPNGAIYLSESGGDARVEGPPVIDITQNYFVDNYDGVVLWENADRFCNSPANTSGGYCTLVAEISDCTPAVIDTGSSYDDCRWKTQNVNVSGNVFEVDKPTLGCAECARNAVFSNWGTFPSWSPYDGPAIQNAIAFDQNNVFSDNTYIGDWSFIAQDGSFDLTFAEWSSAPYFQDTESASRRLPPKSLVICSDRMHTGTCVD